MPKTSAFALGCALLMGTTLPLAAQTVPQAQSAPKTVQAANPCAKAEPATPETTDETAASDGTAPSNAGSTGWSGGTGGSHIGTNPSGATPHTKTWHSPTARGLDLKSTATPAAAC